MPRQKTEAEWFKSLKPYLDAIKENGGRIYEKYIRKLPQFRDVNASTIYFLLNDVASRRYGWIETAKVGEGGELGETKLWILTDRGQEILRVGITKKQRK